MRDDHLIDRVAKEMTGTGPSPRLREAIRARIDARPARRRVWVLVPTAIAAAVLLSVFGILSGPHGTADPRLALPRTSAPAGDAPAAPPQVARIEPSSATQGDEAGPRRAQQALTHAPPRQPVSDAPAVTTDAAVEALVPAIAIPPLDVPQLTLDAGSGVMPIEIDPLQIVPLQVE